MDVDQELAQKTAQSEIIVPPGCRNIVAKQNKCDSPTADDEGVPNHRELLYGSGFIRPLLAACRMDINNRTRGGKISLYLNY
ncbi:hypothetical protein NQ318_008353 [Aromia moschata]|uniref:Uncharacterized protein n=1 Tax=Aromia moschata TaxID=1265417 RepID=A0AAV8YJS8_9CUCU|nr:hypothetical protein NQ318_008353 [Aromia moschata]